MDWGPVAIGMLVRSPKSYTEVLPKSRSPEVLLLRLEQIHATGGVAQLLAGAALHKRVAVGHHGGVNVGRSFLLKQRKGFDGGGALELDFNLFQQRCSEPDRRSKSPCRLIVVQPPSAGDVARLDQIREGVLPTKRMDGVIRLSKLLLLKYMYLSTFNNSISKCFQGAPGCRVPEWCGVRVVRCRGGARGVRVLRRQGGVTAVQGLRHKWYSGGTRVARVHGQSTAVLLAGQGRRTWWYSFPSSIA